MNVTMGRRGSVFLYSILAMVTFIGFVALGVDWGRMQLQKSELASATDAAAIAGASLVYNGGYYARNEAKRIAAMNTVGGKPLVLLDSDIRIGRWNATTRTLDTTSSSPDAVEVTAYLSKARNSAIPLIFAGILTRQSAAETKHSATAIWVGSPGIYQKVQGTANPFLAGMPAGSTASRNNPHDSPDRAGDEFSSDVSKQKQSPIEASKNGSRFQVGNGQQFTFNSISGSVRHDPNDDAYEPDGKLSDIGHNNTTSDASNSKNNRFYHENNIHDVVAPINALVGVFIDDDQAPTKTPLPTFSSSDHAETAPTDYSSYEARNRLTYRPKLNQIFFIGDGLTDDGIQQKFIAPPGAGRLYLATWDFYEWNNNSGERTVQINASGSVQLVK